MSQIRLQVQKRHIRSGRRGSRFYCPIGLALTEQFPDRKVIVQLDEIRVGDEVYITPENAAQFMYRYDRSRSKLDLPPRSFSLSKKCRTCSHKEHPPGLCTGMNTKGSPCWCNTGSITDQ